MADTLGQGPDEVDRSILESASASAGVPALHVEDALGVGGFGSTIVWKQFLFLLCASIPDNGTSPHLQRYCMPPGSMLCYRLERGSAVVSC